VLAAGARRTAARSKTGKSQLAAKRSRARAYVTPPARIRIRRFHTSPRMPRKGSTALAMTFGRLSSSPT
jgi:hypothetical protein